MATKSRKTRQVTFKNVSPLLDATNLRILREMSADPRIAMTELARRINLSAPATTERVQRLMEGGVIRGVRLEIDQASLGLPITAYVRVRPMPGALTQVSELSKSIPEIVECHRVTGEDCFIMKVLVAQVDELEVVLDQLLAYGNTTSSIVQSTPVPPRGPPLPGSEAQ